MKIEEWKAKNKQRRRYAHFDNKVSLDDVWDYINNSKNIEKHSFYPFIQYKHTYNKYSKDKGMIPKERCICYSAHIDRNIFQLYGYKLNQLYNARVEEDDIDKSAIAYRDNLNKNNIDFAKLAIDYIREKNNCYIIIGDFTKFFDRIDHAYLKNIINDLLHTKELPNDYYAVYKNITKYSIWEMQYILKINGITDNNKGIKQLNKLGRALPFDKFKEYKKQYVNKNKKNFGIPQGSAISAVLSNIYMLESDKKLHDYISKRDGLYMRYSDDFIIVLPKNNEILFKQQFTYINNIIKATPKLELQPDKTKVFEYNDKLLTSCNEIVLYNISNDKNLMNYLGFKFDGNVVTIRDKTISKYYYRMYRKIKTIIKNDGYSKNKKKISSKNIYEKFSIKGINSGRGNFFNYVKKSEKIFGENEAINRGTKNHMQKIKRKLHILKNGVN